MPRITVSWSCWLVLALLPTGLDSQQPPNSSGSDLQDPIAPLVPKRARTEAEHDRLQALAMFAAGRMAEQKQDLAGALRLYERALRSDPEALPVLREIVPLAFNLDRQAEAVRYALLAAEMEGSDPVLLQRLALYLTEEGDWDQAAKLYEKAAALAPARDNPSSSDVLLAMEMGRLYYLTKRYGESADRFAVVWKALERPDEVKLDASVRKALVGKPELSYQLFGESFLEAGRMDEAKAAFEKGHELHPNAGQMAFNLARIEAKEQHPEEALKQLALFFDSRLSDQGTAPYQLLADVLETTGQSGELFERLEKIRQHDRKNVPLAYFLAQRYQQADEVDRAEAVYQQILEQSPKRPPLEAYQELIAIDHRAKRTEALLKVLGEAVTKAGNLSPLGEQAKAVAADADEVQTLIDAARAQLKADDTKVPYGERLAVALLALENKQFDAAEEFFSAALVAEPKNTAELLLTWGLELLMANQYADAAKVFQRAVDDANLAEKQKPSFQFYLASALEMSGRTDDALVAIHQAIEAQQDSPRFAAREGWILLHAKRYAAAKQSYQAIVDKFNAVHDSTEVRDVLREVRLALSNACVLEGNLPESEEWLEQVLDEFPTDVGAMNDLGYLWADAGKHLQRALRMLERAVAKEPKNMAYRDSLGWVLYRLDRYPEALEHLRQAAAVEEPDGVIFDHLGDVLARMGDRPAAIDAWSSAERAFEKAEEHDKARQAQGKITEAER